MKVKEFLRLGLIALVIGLGMGYALAAWNPPTGGPSDLAGTNTLHGFQSTGRWFWQ
ncbi:MAG: hypothetical protein HYT46_00420 [Candidatus Vogelbacteria bacterium]|nr:hypothetical protein [Candidatus Vogelbacteria bacterium]